MRPALEDAPLLSRSFTTLSSDPAAVWPLGVRFFATAWPRGSGAKTTRSELVTVSGAASFGEATFFTMEATTPFMPPEARRLLMDVADLERWTLLDPAALRPLDTLSGMSVVHRRVSS